MFIFVVMMSANKSISSVSRLDIKPTGARQIRFDGREKWSDPTCNVQMDLIGLLGSTAVGLTESINHFNSCKLNVLYYCQVYVLFAAVGGETGSAFDLLWFLQFQWPVATDRHSAGYTGHSVTVTATVLLASKGFIRCPSVDVLGLLDPSAVRPRRPLPSPGHRIKLGCILRIKNKYIK